MVNTRKSSRQAVPTGIGSRRVQARLAAQERRIAQLERTIATLGRREEARADGNCPTYTDGPVGREYDPAAALALFDSWLQEDGAGQAEEFDAMAKAIDESRAGGRTLFS